MNITLEEVCSRKQMRVFIHLPAKIHKGHKTWLPNIYFDEWAFFDPKKNHAFGNCRTKLMLAFKDRKAVGRIMGIINIPYNEIRNEANARFGYLECYDDQDVAHALLQSIEQWAKKNGMQKIVGPYGFSDKDPQGLLIDGFEHPPLLSSASNYPYLVRLVEQEGYVKEIDCFVYKYSIAKDIPEVYQRIIQRVNRTKDYKIIEFTKRKQIKPYIHRVLTLMNETYSQIYGFVPMNSKEMDEFANRYMPVLDPRFVKLVEKDGQIISFIIALPHITAGIQRSKGYLFPFGIVYILRAARKTRQLDLMLGAVHPKYQGLGIDVLMTIPLLQSAQKCGFTEIEIHLMLETNREVLAEMKRVHARLHKTFRVYQKQL